MLLSYCMFYIMYNLIVNSIWENQFLCITYFLILFGKTKVNIIIGFT